MKKFAFVFLRKDEKFVFKNYLLQSMACALFIGLALFFFSGFGNKPVVASLGASSFIAFSFPHAESSRPRYLVGSYVLGGFFGTIFNSLHVLLAANKILFFGMEPYIVLCGFAVFCTMFCMVSFNYEHPPAAALSFSLILEKNPVKMALLAIAGVLLLSLVKRALKKNMINLS